MNEWLGDPHTLIVRAVHAPHGLLDHGCLDYDLEHPSSCGQEERDYGGGVTVQEYICDIAYIERDSGLAGPLRYSGTPVTEPGVYQVQAWGSKSWTDCGWEHDNGVIITGPGDKPYA